MPVLVEMGKEDEFQTSAKHHAVQVIFFVLLLFLHFWDDPKLEKNKQTRKRKVRITSLLLGMNLVGMEQSLDMDLFL